ncbi:MAG: tetratricopeptide repeat protein, partial [Candidatus Eremiobacterota bacterium]
PRLVGVMAAAFAAGLLPYLYPLIRARSNPGLNWDDPRDLSGLLHLFFRRDYGTFALMPDQARESLGHTSRFDQLPAYFGDVLAGAALVLGLLALAGLVDRALQDRSTVNAEGGLRPQALRAPPALAIALAWLFPGPIFLMVANCPLSHPYYQGVAERFYVLPQLPLAMLAGAGTAWLCRRLPPLGAVIAAGVLAMGLSHYDRVDQSRNTVGVDAMHNLLATLPENALFLTVGDGPTMLLEYAQFGLGLRPDVVVLDQDKLKYPWYVSSKRRNHSSVTFPWKVYDEGRTATMAEFVAANYGTRPILLWGTLDPSVHQRFRLLPAGLAQRVADPGENPTPDEMAAHVEKVWAGYEKRSMGDRYDPRRFEYLLTSFYGFPFYNVGGEYAATGRLDQAEEYYRKAIEAAPHYALPHRQLGLLLLRQGRPQGSAELEAYLELEPDAHDAAELRKLLSR